VVKSKREKAGGGPYPETTYPGYTGEIRTFRDKQRKQTGNEPEKSPYTKRGTEKFLIHEVPVGVIKYGGQRTEYVERSI